MIIQMFTTDDEINLLYIIVDVGSYSVGYFHFLISKR